MKIQLGILLLSSLAFAQFNPLPALVGSVASATTIAVTAPIMIVTGTTPIATITPPTYFTTTGIGGCVPFKATGAWSTTSAGNITTASVFTAVSGNVYWGCYDAASATWSFPPAASSTPATLTGSYVVVPYDSGATQQSAAEAANAIVCYDFPVLAALTLTTSYQYVSTAAGSGVFGVAIYTAAGAIVTSLTQTGTSATSTGAVSVALGGGTVTLTPGTSGRYSLCYSTNGTGLEFYGGAIPLSTYTQPSGAPIFYTTSNHTSTASTTITWPATLGTKTAIGAGTNPFPTTILLP